MDNQNSMQAEITIQPPNQFSRLPIFLGLLVLFLLFASSFLAYQNIQLHKQIASKQTAKSPTLKPTPSPTSIPTADLTVNWKTYSNKYLYYQISVPQDWIVDEIDRSNFPAVRLSSPDKKIEIFDPVDLPLGEEPGTFSEVIIMSSAQVGQYTAPRSYQSFRTKNMEQAKLIHVNTNDVAHPQNLYLPFFGIIVKGDLDKSDPLILKVLKTFKNTGSTPDIDDLISYSAPSEWQINKEDKSIQSPDYVEGIMGSGQKGMHISISSYFSLPGHTLEYEKNDWKQTTGISGISNTTIDSLPAFKLHVDFEGHALQYYVIKGGYGFNIRFSSSSLSEEQKHQKQIDEFIKSIQLK